MSEASEHPESMKLMQKIRQQSGDKGLLNYQEFIQAALYDPEFGYYCKDTPRVGRNEQSDFYTSQSLGPVFGVLVIDAIRHILSAQTDLAVNLSDWTLVEVGYESDAGWWKEGECPFANVIRIGPSNPIDFRGQCVVFSNELFDAQPFHRVVYINGKWQELGVDVSGETARETLLENLSAEVSQFKNQLPLDVEEGYVLDLPLSTKPLLKQLTDANWSGLFVALDYGKSWTELAHDFPQGTARAYYKHKQSPHLIAQPGMQDLTCHICWNWLQDGLDSAGFKSITLESQEAFFVKHAVDRIQTIVTANVGQFDPVRQNLMHLIHPATMGQKFQVLWGFRPGHFSVD